MNIRKLKEKDAVLMHEWMCDASIVSFLRTDFINMTIDDCYKFIEKSAKDLSNLHFAIVDDCDNYMGTVSLKSVTENNAEFAICVRHCAMGKGYASYGMHWILDYAFQTLKLKCVYWYVNSQNIRALKFYTKNGYKPVSSSLIDTEVKKDLDPIGQYAWFMQLNSDINL